MSRFDLYSYLANEGHTLRKEDLQRISIELVYAIYRNNKEQYQAIMDEAIDSINEYTGLALPYENANNETCQGYKNRDTWLVALWINNHEPNYKLAKIQYSQQLGVAWDDTTKYHYGDKINFMRVAVEEIQSMLDEMMAD